MTINRLTSCSPSNTVIQHVPYKAVHSFDLPGQCILLLSDTQLPVLFGCCHLGENRKIGAFNTQVVCLCSLFVFAVC